MFRQREHVRIGTPDQVGRFRELWMERGKVAMQQLCLPHELDVANDPFFGRSGRVLAVSQRQQALKFEMLIPVNSKESPTACISFNYHLDHFGQTWGLRLPDGTCAHSACVGFGLERLTLALFRHHGFHPVDWPRQVRDALWP
jgi:seryl-tRNA synthetase